MPYNILNTKMFVENDPKQLVNKIRIKPLNGML